MAAKGSYRLEPAVSLLRLYHDDDNSYEAKSAAEINVQHVLPGVWVMSAHRSEGGHTRASLRALLQAALDHGVHTILADRAAGHRLPGAVPWVEGVGVKIDVRALAARFGAVASS